MDSGFPSSPFSPLMASSRTTLSLGLSPQRDLFSSSVSWSFHSPTPTLALEVYLSSTIVTFTTLKKFRLWLKMRPCANLSFFLLIHQISILLNKLSFQSNPTFGDTGKTSHFLLLMMLTATLPQTWLIISSSPQVMLSKCIICKSQFHSLATLHPLLPLWSTILPMPTHPHLHPCDPPYYTPMPVLAATIFNHQQS
jgi:hypothetical protein